MIIGYTNPSYPVLRNIYNKCSKCQYVRVRSFKSLSEKILAHVGLRPSCFKGCSFYGGFPEGLHHVDLYHFFNHIALPPCRASYITTFETFLPRSFPSGDILKCGINSLVSDRCRKLIALSKHARRRQMEFSFKHGFVEIGKKITVLLPPQEVLCNEQNIETRYGIHNLRNGIRLIFVGKDFFRKGGSEIVKALIEVRKDFQVEAFVIGDFEHVDYASSWDVDSADEMQRLFAENSHWLHHYGSMPNGEMLALAKTCHIGLLPTRDDTFGYSVLEFQACGLPCITTDIRALPEVNCGDIGWMVNVPKLANGCADFSTTERLYDLTQIIEKQLVATLYDALSSQESIREKGLRALGNIRRNHSLQLFSDRLWRLYEEALG